MNILYHASLFSRGCWKKKPLFVQYVKRDNTFIFKFLQIILTLHLLQSIAKDAKFIVVYHDNPEITDRHKLRVMVAIPVENATRRTDSIGVTRFAGGKYGVCRFLLKNSEFMEAWDWMFSVWLNNSGYEKDDRDTFERCRGEQIINSKRFFDVDICIPVKVR